MRHTSLMTAGLCLLGVLRAQCCAPLYQTYLSEFSMRVERAENPNADTLRIHVQYAKEGARAAAAYQGYLIAYLDRDAGKVPAPAPADVIDPSRVVVLHTQLMKRREKDDSPAPTPTTSTSRSAAKSWSRSSSTTASSAPRTATTRMAGTTTRTTSASRCSCRGSKT